jgi:hypothetical protein
VIHRKNGAYPRNDNAAEKQDQHHDGADLSGCLAFDIRADQNGGGSGGNDKRGEQKQSLHGTSPNSAAQTHLQGASSISKRAVQ